MKDLEKSALTNLLTLIFLFEFLRKDVIPLAQENKMTLQNIAICFAPCLMWAETRSIKDLVYATKSVRVVSHMISDFEKIFGSPKEQKKLFRSSYYEQKKKSLTEAFILEKEK